MDQTLQLTKRQTVWDRVTGITSNPFRLAVSHQSHMCQILRIIRGSPGYGTVSPTLLFWSQNLPDKMGFCTFRCFSIFS